MAVDDASAILKETPPPPPGLVPFGKAMDKAPKLSALATTGETLAFVAATPPTLPAAWQPLANWCGQPAPSFAGSANAIHFYLNNRAGIGYEGFLYYKPASPPFNWFSRNRFHGTGHIYPNVPWGELYKSLGPSAPERMPAPWVRIIIALKATSGLAGLTFHQAGGSGALPGAEVGWAEEDVQPPGGTSPHYVAGFGEWILYMELTQHLL